MRDLNRPGGPPRPVGGSGAPPRPAGGGDGNQRRDRTPGRPIVGSGRQGFGGHNVAKPPPPLKPIQQQLPKPNDKPAPPSNVARRLADIPQELLNQLSGKGGSAPTGDQVIQEVLRQKEREKQQQATPTPPGGKPLAQPVPVPDSEEGDDKGKGGAKRPGAIPGRDERHKQRNERQAKRRSNEPEVRVVTRAGVVEMEERHRKARNRPKIKLPGKPFMAIRIRRVKGDSVKHEEGARIYGE